MSEENVDVEATLTEELASAREGIEPKKDSAVLGKFKDVDALARAYEALQAEFTRRSQRLRILERQAENFKAPSGEPSGAEKLRKTANARRAATKEFDEFVAEVGAPASKREKPALSNAPSVADSSAEEGSSDVEEGLLDASGEGTSEHAKAPQEKEASTGLAVGEAKEAFAAQERVRGVASEELLRGLDDDVRLKIVGEYLASLGRAGVPLTMKDGGVLVAPPVKAKTVGEAGNMALQYFRMPTA